MPSPGQANGHKVTTLTDEQQQQQPAWTSPPFWMLVVNILHPGPDDARRAFCVQVHSRERFGPVLHGQSSPSIPFASCVRKHAIAHSLSRCRLSPGQQRNLLTGRSVASGGPSRLCLVLVIWSPISSRGPASSGIDYRKSNFRCDRAPVCLVHGMCSRGQALAHAVADLSSYCLVLQFGRSLTPVENSFPSIRSGVSSRGFCFSQINLPEETVPV